MRCQTISSFVGNAAKDYHKVDQDISAWLQVNKEIRIISVNQVALGIQYIITTIIYE